MRRFVWPREGEECSQDTVYMRRNGGIYGSIAWRMNREGARFRVEVIKEFVCMDVCRGTGERRQHVTVSKMIC